MNSDMISKEQRSLSGEYRAFWEEGNPLPVDKDMIYAQDGDLFIAVDNTSNECYVEEFKTEEDVIKWFNEFEKDDEIEI